MGDEWSGLPGSYSLIGSGSDIIEGTSLSVTIAASVSAFCAAYGVNIASTGIAGGQTEVQNVIATWMAEWITASGTSQVMTTTFSGSNPGTLYAFSLGDVTPPPPSDTVYFFRIPVVTPTTVRHHLRLGRQLLMSTHRFIRTGIKCFSTAEMYLPTA
jgi:hypothetical protein